MFRRRRWAPISPRSTVSASPSSNCAPASSETWPSCFSLIPRIVKDSEQDDLDAITLSYTMYPVRQPRPKQSGFNAGVPGDG